MEDNFSIQIQKPKWIRSNQKRLALKETNYVVNNVKTNQ